MSSQGLHLKQTRLDFGVGASDVKHRNIFTLLNPALRNAEFIMPKAYPRSWNLATFA